MRHFRTADDILEMLVEWHAEQGFPAYFHDGQAFVVITEEGETGAIEMWEINLTQIANRLWEECNAKLH